MWPGSSIPATTCTAEAIGTVRIVITAFVYPPRTRAWKFSGSSSGVEKNLAGFNSHFRFTQQKHICAAAKNEASRRRKN